MLFYYFELRVIKNQIQIIYVELSPPQKYRATFESDIEPNTFFSGASLRKMLKYVLLKQLRKTGGSRRRQQWKPNIRKIHSGRTESTKTMKNVQPLFQTIHFFKHFMNLISISFEVFRAFESLSKCQSSKENFNK